MRNNVRIAIDSGQKIVHRKVLTSSSAESGEISYMSCNS